MSSTATEKWEQTALEQLVRSPDREGHAPGDDREGRMGGREGWDFSSWLHSLAPKAGKMPLPGILKSKRKGVNDHASEREREKVSKSTNQELDIRSVFLLLLLSS